MKTNYYFRSLMVGLFLSFLLGSVHAQFAGGSGTTRDPYLIETPDQFDAIREHRDKKFKLMADLDFTGYDREDGKGWWPVGEWGSGDNAPERFSGVFDGNGYKIMNLVAERVAHDLSVFGVTDGAKIVNLIIENCKITGEGRLGVLTGATFRTEIDQVAVINSECLNTLSDHGSNAGGITGPLTGSTITNSYVKGGVAYGKDGIGGISSVMESGSTIANCYTTCSVEGDTNIGGITGRNSGGTIMNSLVLSNELICHDVNDGRIAGIINGGDLVNNYAGKFVTVNGVETTTDVGLNLKSGENVEGSELATVDFYASKLKFAILETDPDDDSYVQIWKLDNNISEYPVFVWQKSSGSAISSVSENNQYAFALNNGELSVSGLVGGERIEIYTINGKSDQIRTTSNETENFLLKKSGLYIIQIISDNSSVVFKVIN